MNNEMGLNERLDRLGYYIKGFSEGTGSLVVYAKDGKFVGYMTALSAVVFCEYVEGEAS